MREFTIECWLRANFCIRVLCRDHKMTSCRKIDWTLGHWTRGRCFIQNTRKCRRWPCLTARFEGENNDCINYKTDVAASLAQSTHSSGLSLSNHTPGLNHGETLSRTAVRSRKNRICSRLQVWGEEGRANQGKIFQLSVDATWSNWALWSIEVTVGCFTGLRCCPMRSVSEGCTHRMHKQYFCSRYRHRVSL